MVRQVVLKLQEEKLEYAGQTISELISSAGKL